jgi:hypothetical protein
MIADLEKMDRKTLETMLVDFAKNWLAHDGLWFQAMKPSGSIRKPGESSR